MTDTTRIATYWTPDGYERILRGVTSPRWLNGDGYIVEYCKTPESAIAFAILQGWTPYDPNAPQPVFPAREPALTLVELLREALRLAESLED